MKKLYAILLSVVLTIALVCLSGCSEKNSKNEVSVTQNVEVVQTQAKYDYLVLVNKQNKLPDDWEENVELVDTKDAWGDDIKVERQAYEKYLELAKALEAEGVIIKLDSVYRSVQEQQDLWDLWSADPEKGPEYVQKYVSKPGYSEHHTGLAIDICLEKDGELEWENDDMIADRETFAIIHAKLADYGFILRYLEGKDDITGYAYEPWHLRYVGTVEIAREIMDKGLTLEEYLAINK